jgi:uncharacterized Zn-finger protein
LFVAPLERDAHERRPHTNGHGRIATPTPFDCVECNESLSSKADLLRHAKEKQHQPYSCECGALFSRLDVLNRHLESLGTDEPKHPCKYCRRHRGANGFRRRDHLTQHIRNYHHLELDDESTAASASRLKFYFPVCSHPDCPQYRDESFKTLPAALRRRLSHSQLKARTLSICAMSIMSVPSHVMCRDAIELDGEGTSKRRI